MKIRIKFSKTGSMKFIGHLDIMRYFQKVMRRAEVDIRYSKGFSPHQVMSFAAPLGVGLTSSGEYMDIEVNSSKSSQSMIAQLNRVMAEGMKIVSYKQLEETSKNAMSSVAAADYTITYRERHRPNDFKQLEDRLSSFAALDTILIEKKTKKSIQEMDIKPFIYQLELKGEEIKMRVATGSANNLKPELVMEAFCQYNQLEYAEFAFQVQREELFAQLEVNNEKTLVSLEALGEDIEE